MKKLLSILSLTLCTAVMLSSYAFAYIDPSVMTYTIQAIAGVVIAIGAVAGIYCAAPRKRSAKSWAWMKTATRKWNPTCWRTRRTMLPLRRRPPALPNPPRNNLRMSKGGERDLLPPFLFRFHEISHLGGERNHFFIFYRRKSGVLSVLPSGKTLTLGRFTRPKVV